MKQIKLKIINNVWVEVLIGKETLENLLSYTSVYYKRGRYKKERVEYRKTLIKNQKYFYSGFIKRIQNFCKENNINLEIDGKLEYLKPTNKPHIKGIVFRDYQKEFADNIVKHQKCAITAIPAAGKTILALAVISCFKDSKSLFLCNEIGLTKQTAENFLKFGFSVSVVGDGSKDLSGDIVCSTIQSFKNFDLDDMANVFDIIFVDEIHQVGFKDGGSIEKILSKLLAPVRVGLTATPLEDEEGSLITEGLLGPVVSELNFKDAEKIDLVTDAEVKIINVPTLKCFEKDIKRIKKEDTKIKAKLTAKLKDTKGIEKESIKEQIKNIGNKTNYQYFYEHGIVKNDLRNSIVSKEVLNIFNEGKSCIVFATLIDHIKELSELFNLLGIKHRTVHGSISGDEREEIKKQLFNKEILVVISSVVWCSGLDIATLDAIVNAAGGKDSKAIIQKGGRSTRKFEGKDKAIIIDFYDKIKYLSNHSEERIKTYKEVGWLK